MRRPPGPILPREEWLALVGGYLAGAEVPGWEPAAEARARFGACLERLAAGGDVAAVTHGTVIALWLGLSADEWAELPLPAVVEVPA